MHITQRTLCTFSVTKYIKWHWCSICDKEWWAVDNHPFSSQVYHLYRVRRRPSTLLCQFSWECWLKVAKCFLICCKVSEKTVYSSSFEPLLAYDFQLLCLEEVAFKIACYYVMIQIQHKLLLWDYKNVFISEEMLKNGFCTCM